MQGWPYIEFGEAFSVEAMVHGSHVYQDIWDVALGEQQPYKEEPGDRKDSLILVPRTECSWSGNQTGHGSQSLIFVVRNKSAKTLKVKRLENLVLYGI